MKLAKYFLEISAERGRSVCVQAPAEGMSFVRGTVECRETVLGYT